MSYILEALKRAEAERERGKVPGITTHPSTVGPSEDEDDARAPRANLSPIAWGAGLALVVIGGAVAWHLLADRGEAPASAPTQVAQAPAAAPVTPVPATVTPPPLAPAPSIAVAPPPGGTVPATVPPQPVPSPVPAMPAPTATPAPIAHTAPATDDNLPPMPVEVRRELALSIGGSIYSDDPRSRFLILNGQVLHEGDSLMPGVVLEKIRLKSAVLNVRGTRYSLGY